MTSTFKLMKRRQSKAFALRRQELTQKIDSSTEIDKTNISDYWNAATSKLQRDDTIHENKEKTQTLPKKSFDDEYLKELINAEISGVSESAIDVDKENKDTNANANRSIANSSKVCVDNVVEFFENNDESIDVNIKNNDEDVSNVASFNKEFIEILDDGNSCKSGRNTLMFDFKVNDTNKIKRSKVKSNSFKKSYASNLKRKERRGIDKNHKESSKNFESDVYDVTKIEPKGEESRRVKKQKMSNQSKEKSGEVEEHIDATIAEAASSSQGFNKLENEVDKLDEESDLKVSDVLKNNKDKSTSFKKKSIQYMKEFESTIITEGTSISQKLSFIKSKGDVDYIRNINEINGKKNQIAYLLQNSNIETSTMFLKENSLVKNIVANKSFSLLVLKGHITILINQNEIALKKYGLVLINKDDEYLIRNEGKNDSILFLTYSIQ